MPKIVVVMTYFNRLFQIERTLASILRSYFRNFEIVVVDDYSTETVDFSIYGRKIHTLRIGQEKNWCNPVIPYNLGIHKALTFNPDIIILQNAECYHYGDVLTYAAAYVRNDNYISFSAMCLDQNRTSIGVTDQMIKDILPLEYAMPYNPVEPELGWYNHPTYLPRAYDFCSAISIANLRKLNGYDERFASHIWYGDNDLILRIRRLGLNVEIPEFPFVVHQWHDHNHITEDNSIDDGLNLYKSIEQNETGFRAVHTYSSEL